MEKTYTASHQLEIAERSDVISFLKAESECKGHLGRYLEYKAN